MTIDEGAHTLGFDLTVEQHRQLSCHRDALTQWSQRVGLVSASSLRHVDETHFLDSLVLLKLADVAEGACVLDIGSGAGFPGLVWAVALPHAHMTLLEPRRKRAAFLEFVVTHCGVSNCRVVTETIEEHARRANVGPYDVAVSRAVRVTAPFEDAVVRTLSAHGKFVHPIMVGDHRRETGTVRTLSLPWDRTRSRIVRIRPAAM
ncbi:MAG: hypothetical protein FJX78_06315 [Armatimonadetes bacterium]|nr:hypothetical protein [Armatimonadota bacterium]